jgi:hypothetical protein
MRGVKNMISTWKPYCLEFFKDGHWDEELFDTEDDMEWYYNNWFYDTDIEVAFYKNDYEYTPSWIND